MMGGGGGGVTYDGLASHPGGVAILLVASCYRKRDKRRQLCEPGSWLNHFLSRQSHYMAEKYFCNLRFSNLKVDDHFFLTKHRRNDMMNTVTVPADKMMTGKSQFLWRPVEEKHNKFISEYDVFLLVTQAYSDKVKKIRVLPTGVEPMTFRRS